MSNKALKGLFVPLVTPFHSDESIDFEAYEKIIDYTIKNGMDGLLIGGSTGEFHMMSLEERKALIQKGCKIINGRANVVVCTGQSTAKATVELTNFAADCGADWALVLTPHYQRTTEEGIYEFFKEIAAGSKIGIIVYHSPFATNVELSPQFIRRLAEMDNLVAVKETVGEIHTCKTYAATLDIPNFAVMEANEHLLLPSYAIGIDTAFSIIFNLLPKEMRQLYDLVFEKNDLKAARDLNTRLLPLYDLMEAEPYPGPVKAGLDALGLPGGIVRKPLAQPSNEMRAKVKAELQKLGYAVK